MNPLDGQLTLKGILPKTPASPRKDDRKSSSPTLKPVAAPTATGSKKHPKNSLVAKMRALLALADEAETRGFNLALSGDSWQLKGIEDEFRRAIAQLWLPAKRQCPYALLKELSAELPPPGYDREAPHPRPRICEEIHKRLPRRFSLEWLENRERLAETKDCVGVKKAMKARISEGKRLALQLLKKDIRVTVDSFGDLTIDPTHNPFTDFIVGEPVPGCTDTELVEVLAIFGHDPNRILNDLLPATVSTMIAEEDDAGVNYPTKTGNDAREETYRDYEADPGGSVEYQLHYRDGIFAMIRAHEYPDPVRGEHTQRCQVEEGHRYVDALGVEHVAKGHRYNLCSRNEWVTYLGPPERKNKNGAKRKKGATRKRSRKAS